MTKTFLAVAALLLSLSGIASAAVDPAGVANPVFAERHDVVQTSAAAWMMMAPPPSAQSDQPTINSMHDGRQSK